jgi:sigma-B regulation protein RsbU (phosphoserine phosphatase)
MKVLIAEDDSISRLVLSTKLTKLGHEVVAAEDGEDAWSLFLEDQPQLIITDWMMPKVDGLDLCRLIRSHVQAKYPYIMVLTALTGKKNYLEAMEAGADDFLNKPVDMEELTARLVVAGRILSLHTQMTQLEGLLPICAYCKQIRNDQNTWQPIEGYISERTEAKFSHGYCPDCIEKFVKPDIEAYRLKKLSKQSP